MLTKLRASYVGYALFLNHSLSSSFFHCLKEWYLFYDNRFLLLPSTHGSNWRKKELKKLKTSARKYIVAHNCRLSTLEVERKGSWVQDKAWLHNQTLSPINQNHKNVHKESLLLVLLWDSTVRPRVDDSDYYKLSTALGLKWGFWERKGMGRYETSRVMVEELESTEKCGQYKLLRGSFLCGLRGCWLLV